VASQERVLDLAWFWRCLERIRTLFSGILPYKSMVFGAVFLKNRVILENENFKFSGVFEISEIEISEGPRRMGCSLFDLT